MSERCWAVVPAAGAGRRMGSEVPKQYLHLKGRPVIDYSLRTLLGHPSIEAVLVALSEDDTFWRQTQHANDPRVIRVTGGAERCYSVLNALKVLRPMAADADWVLVHDAARPCLAPEDLDHLIQCLKHHPVGGLLGVPVQDTLKRVAPQGEVLQTIPREDLWHAYTPQMFRLGLLIKALEHALGQGALVTDDASAMELSGHRVVMVEGHAGNLKITRPADLQLAAFYLNRQG